MARIHPDGWQALAVTGAAVREIETLHALKEALPDTYAVYHGVHWTQLKNGFAVFGEADFVVVSPAGAVLVIEQKSGNLLETPDGLRKLYAGVAKDVPAQLTRTINIVHNRLSKAFGSRNYRLDELLYCPDYRVKNAVSAGVPPERIVDATRREQLGAIIQSILPADETPLPCRDGLHALLSEQLALTPDVNAMVGEVSKVVTRISGGLAEWARAIEFSPFRLRVTGTAGSGKTQLAVRVLEDAARAGKRSLYVCYNRPLADHLRRIVPDEALVLTFHQLCQGIATDEGDVIDFSDPGCFAKLEQAFVERAPGRLARFDTIVVDEGQDFMQEWVAPLERLLAADARFWWLEDPMQNLYLRPRVALPGWVEMHAASNYRSPRDVIRFIERLTGQAQAAAASPLHESDVGLLTYGEGQAAQVTKAAVSQALSLGFRLRDIAVLSFFGREKSRFGTLDRLGGWTLCSFTGEYDAGGDPVHRDGELVFESVYRFKGQSAPCVILTEIDFGKLDENIRRRLFVGATRATMKLILVMSERTAMSVIEELG
ncbi:nuclease [Caballeronia calidae]|uniref:DNA 3'-5' helicase II n=1 Tax=Caballeronia calidae TaxID=1777139 RepID=A0A158EE85_9BURK|nr:ATP-binding domain-containing protein [Caballeronia calidae]SAL05158.1 nuclease [Caballeronia calidae]